MTDFLPTFPPLLSGHVADTDENPLKSAAIQADAGQLGAGDLIWSDDGKRLHFAVVLEPDVTRDRCGEMVYVAMVAFGDAAGALIPPEVAITYQWPNVIEMNDGQIGAVELVISDEEDAGIPEWMVLGVEIQLSPELSDMNPGDNYHQTTFWDEGCGEITQAQLLESTSRHLVNVIHTWSEEGFKPIHEQWSGRQSKANPLVRDAQLSGLKFVGIDEIGNGLLSNGNKTDSHAVIDMMTHVSSPPVGA